MFAALHLTGGPAPGFAAGPTTASCTKITQRIKASVCFEQAFDAADRALNTTYKAAMASLVALDDRSSQDDPATVGAADALHKAQRGWLAYRDNHCAGVALQDAGGRMQDMVEAECKAKLTDARIGELRRLGSSGPDKDGKR